MQAAVQKYSDSSISKTINLPADISFDAFKDVYRRAYALDCKGCTTYRPNAVTGAMLSVAAAPPAPRATATGGDSDVVYMTQPLERPEALLGRTYQLPLPDSDHTIYITKLRRPSSRERWCPTVETPMGAH